MSFRASVIEYQKALKSVESVLDAAAKAIIHSDVLCEDESWWGDDDDRRQTFQGCTYTNFKTGADNITLRFQEYVGCGEYEHYSLTLPYEALDDIEAWIRTRVEEQNTARQKKADAKAAEEEADRIVAEEAEKEHYLALKEKYEK
jgi:hypothetical protein